MFIDNHHIIPRFEGGSNDSKNLVKLPRKMHQEVHHCRWLVYGKISDLYAYNLLGGKLNDYELNQLYEDQVYRCKRDKDKLTQARLESNDWKMSHQKEEYRKLKK